MGEMTIKVDDATLIALHDLASRRGIHVDALASELLHAGVHGADRAAGTRRDLSSTDVIREWRDA